MSFTFSTFNINTDMRVGDGFARNFFAEWNSKNRELLVNKAIPLTDIIHLQETRKIINSFGEEIDSLTPILKHLENQNYNFVVQKQIPLFINSFQYITAYKQDKFEDIGSELLYFTKTPLQIKGEDYNNINNLPEEHIDKKILKHNLGETFERCTLITKLRDKVTDDILYTFNLHMSHLLEHRIKSSEIIREYINDLPSNIKIIIAGDFNSFVDYGGEVQINTLLESDKLTEISKNLKSQDGIEILNDVSFIPFPYDCVSKNKEAAYQMRQTKSKEAIFQIYKDSCNALSSQLDHIIISRNLIKIGDPILKLTYQNPFLDNFNEENIKNFVLQNVDSPAFASDHQPIIVTLNYYNDSVDQLL